MPIILSAWMAFIISGGQFEGSFVPGITGNVSIMRKSNYFWAMCELGRPWGPVCVVMLPYNLLANGLAIIQAKIGDQKNAFAYSAYGEIRTHSQVYGKKHNHIQTDDDSVTLDSSSELHNADSNDDMDCTS